MSSKKRILSWGTQASAVLTVNHGSRQLHVACARVAGTTSWGLIAVEGPRVENGTPGEAIEAVLGDHRHESLGTAEGLKAAMDKAEAYADKWQRSKASEDKCACEVIDIQNHTKGATR
jgi:hypothetical protein